MTESINLTPDLISPVHVSSQEVTTWLRSKQPAFTQALSVFASKIGMGYEKHWRDAYIGEFTGAGLCGYAATVLGQTLKYRYGPNIDVICCSLYTKFMDLETHNDFSRGLQPRYLPHNILLYHASGENGWYIADATYRQLQIRVNPDKMLIGAPLRCGEELYTSLEIYERVRLEDPAEASFLYLPEYHSPNELNEEILDHISRGKIMGVGLIDYLELFAAFV